MQKNLLHRKKMIQRDNISIIQNSGWCDYIKMWNLSKFLWLNSREILITHIKIAMRLGQALGFLDLKWRWKKNKNQST